MHNEGNGNRLNPVDIRNKDFSRTMWGYSPREVVEYLDAVAQSLNEAQHREKEIHQQIEKLKEDVQKWKAREDEFDAIRMEAKQQSKELMESAYQEAETLLNAAKTRAEKIRSKTEEWLEKILTQIEETEEKRQIFLRTFRGTLDQHYRLLEDSHAIPEVKAELGELVNGKSNPTN